MNPAQQEAALQAQQEAALKAQQEAALKAQQEAALKAQQEAQKAAQKAQQDAQKAAQKAQQDAQNTAQQAKSQNTASNKADTSTKEKTSIKLVDTNIPSTSTPKTTSASNTAKEQPKTTTVSTSGSNTGSLLRDAKLAAGKGDLATATHLLDQVTKQDPQNADAWETYAKVSARQGKYPIAASQQEKACKVKNTAACYNILGDYRSKAGMSVEAQAAYRKALEIDPNNAQAKSKLTP